MINSLIHQTDTCTIKQNNPYVLHDLHSWEIRFVFLWNCFICPTTSYYNDDNDNEDNKQNEDNDNKDNDNKDNDNEENNSKTLGIHLEAYPEQPTTLVIYPDAYLDQPATHNNNKTIKDGWVAPRLLNIRCPIKFN